MKKPTKKSSTIRKKVSGGEMYCEKCGHCGFIECCGITEFLRKHVLGKTGCPNEDLVLNDLISLLNGSLRKEMEQKYLEKCGTCKKDTCSGWHQVKLPKKNPNK